MQAKFLALAVLAAVGATSLAQAQNLILDGTMDGSMTIMTPTAANVTPAGWIGTGTAGWNQCWRIQGGAMEYGYGNTYNQAAYQVLTPQAVGEYVFSYDLTMLTRPTSGFTIALGMISGAETANPGKYTFQGSPDKLVFEEFMDAFSGDKSYNVTVTDATKYLVVAFAADGPVSGNVIQIDNVSLTAAAAVPEPASLGLLGLGSLLAIRRRRA